MFSGGYLIECTDYLLSHLSQWLLDCHGVVDVKDHHRHNVTSNPQWEYTGIYQALLESTLRQG